MNVFESHRTVVLTVLELNTFSRLMEGVGRGRNSTLCVYSSWDHLPSLRKMIILHNQEETDVHLRRNTTQENWWRFEYDIWRYKHPSTREWIPLDLNCRNEYHGKKEKAGGEQIYKTHPSMTIEWKFPYIAMKSHILYALNRWCNIWYEQDIKAEGSNWRKWTIFSREGGIFYWASK